MHKLTLRLLILSAVLATLTAFSVPLTANDKCCGDKDEVTVTIDQVPTAVADTIRSQAGSGTIDEIEKETKNGKVKYSADITRDGKKFEIKVAPDGKLLKVEEEDDND